MSPPDYRDPTDPQEWLRRARSSLVRSRVGAGVPEVLHEDLCFDAQQAAEKAIKAVLVNRSVEFPKTHSIVDLLSLAYQSGQNIPDQIRQAGVLTRYAVETRYPGLAEPPSKEDYQRAVTLAEQVVRWAENLISSEHPK